MKRVIFPFAAFLFFVCLSGLAQDTATIVGTVSDTTGAVIPEAKVTVSNPSKGFTRELVSNAAGEYTAAKVPIGDYVITAEASGFQKLVRTGITLTVGQTLRVDLQMTLGQVTQEVTVTGNVARVETETAAISDVVTGTQISNMMMNGRNFVTLALLVPGAVPMNGLNSTSVGVYGNNSISFNGGRTQYNNWEIDGGNNTDEGSASTFNTYPNVDTIAEFRISTSNYGAEMGKHAGATIEVATKSGTKDFHGDVFEYVRNDHFDANDWFVNRQINPPGGKAPKRPLKWNDYGYTFGGPFYIPGRYNTDKSKTFFFWSQNWRKYREGQVVSAGVPSLRMRPGDFSECDKASPNFNAAISDCKVPINPATGVAFPGDIVPIDPNGKALLDGLIPLPNNGVTGYIAAPSTPVNWRQEQIRVDQNISDKTSLFVRYTQDAWDTTVVPSLWTSANYDTIKTQFSGPGKSAVLHITHSFKPNLMNEFVMAYTVDHILLFPQAGASSVAGSINKPSSWTASNLFPPNKNNPLLPGTSIGGGAGFGATEEAGDRPWFNSNPIITWKDNVAWTAGKHTLKFGLFVEDYRKNEQFGSGTTQGFMTFSGSSPISTKNGLADMYLGRMSEYREATLTFNGVPVGGYGKGHYQMTAFEPYIQDDWRVNRKLTLNIGARYYLFSRIRDVSRPTLDSTFIPNLYNPANEGQLDANGKFIPGTGHNFTTYGNGLVECGTGAIVKGCQTPYYWTLAPRFGFAYDPTGSGKTVIRGGYGIYFEMGNGNEAQTEGTHGNPPTTLGPSGFNIAGYQNIAPGAIGPPNIQTLPYNQKWGSTQQFSLGIQHEFPGNNLLTLSYVGSLGRHLARNRNINQIPIGVGTMNVPALAGVQGCDATGNCNVQDVLINNRKPNIFFVPYRGYGVMGMRENTAVSSYNSLQATFRHAFGHGVTFGTTYTWSHAIDDWSSVFSRSNVDDYNLTRWRATSELNRTHVLTLNYIYDLPFFKSASNSVVRTVLGGWQISSITSFFTGTPINFGCGIQGRNTGIGGGARCNSLAPVKIEKGVFNDPEFGPTPSWYDPSAVGQVTLDQLRADGQPGMFGTMGRNPLTGPGRNNWDMALHKNFEVPWLKGEHSTVQFRWETFNTFNHPQWKGVNAGCDGLTPAGQPCARATVSGNTINLRRGQINSAWPSRVMQFGLKFIF